MTLYNNKYRIESSRFKGWDYGSNGYYFITICTKDRINFFCDGYDIRNLNNTGIIVNNIWLEIPNNFPYAQLDAFIVMPNHIHGIIIIHKNHYAGTDKLSNDAKKGGITSIHNPMLNETISRILRWYKGRTSYEIKKTNIAFGWQPRFHDHIIRNADSYLYIQDYIISNPEKWEEDTFFM